MRIQLSLIVENCAKTKENLLVKVSNQKVFSFIVNPLSIIVFINIIITFSYIPF